MMRSLYSGVSGLKNHQTRMDVIGNNISNVNTVGYKMSRTVFQDVYSQTVRAASVGGNGIGGTNPSQIGLGVKLGTIDVLHTSAAMQRTDNPLDFAIEGDGYFIVDTNGIDTTFGNNPSDNAGLKYTRAGNFYVDNSGYLVSSNGYFLLGFMNPTTGTPAKPQNPPQFPTASSSAPILDSTLQQINISGYTSISVDEEGVIWGIDENDDKYALAKIALAMFDNPNGLEKNGTSLYSKSANSGAPKNVYSFNQGAGKISAGGLEMSNVDLATEFTDMIVTQRGFQANSRVITTSDTMLEELVNLKR